MALKWSYVGHNVKKGVSWNTCLICCCRVFVQFFLSNRAVYLLLWNIRLGYEHAGLDFWLSSIACHAPKAPVLIVGSHKDQVEFDYLYL